MILSNFSYTSVSDLDFEITGVGGGSFGFLALPAFRNFVISSFLPKIRGEPPRSATDLFGFQACRDVPRQVTFKFLLIAFSLHTTSVARHLSPLLLLPPRWNAVPSQGSPHHQLINLGRERHCESKVSCPRTQHNAPSQGLNTDHSMWRAH